MNTEPLLEASQVCKEVVSGGNTLRILEEASFQLFAGELVLLVGPSGSGKTTFLSVLAGLLPPTSGQVDLCGCRISGAPGARRTAVRRSHVGFVFQTYNLFPALTAVENVAEVIVMKERVKRREAHDRATEMLRHLGLEGRLGERPHRLSGGEQQRIAVARALAANPTVVMGDEPTAALDRDSSEVVMSALRSFVGPSTGVVLVTHDLRLEVFADRVVELEDGRVVGVRKGRHEA